MDDGLEAMDCERKPVIGLLGAPGSGKSLVARQFAALGCAVIDADQLAKEALEEPAVRDQLIAWWGSEVIDEEGHVDRGAVARIVFNSPANLDRLEGLVHPRVAARRAALHREFQADPSVKAIVEDCPLLLEKQLDSHCDRLVFVDVPREIRLRRVAQSRGWSDEELAAREKNQMPLDIKRKRAHDVVDNSAEESNTLQQVRRVLSVVSPD